MVTVGSVASLLPGVKCSNCGVEVQLSMMGEHVCSTSQQAHPATESASDGTRTSRVSRVASQVSRSNSKRGRRLRVDSSAANKPFLRPNELTPVNSGTLPPVNEPYGRNGSSHQIQQPSPRIGLPQSPPSPEYSNLDCAFPPFPTARSRTATPVPEAAPSNSHFDSDHVREHTEPYHRGRPPSPSPRYPRAKLTDSPRSNHRRGFVGTPPLPVSRPSDASIRETPLWASQASAHAIEQLSAGGHEHKTSRGGLPLDSGGHGVLRPKPSPRGEHADRPLPSRPFSPNHPPSHPPHAENRTSGDQGMGYAARRSSHPLPESPTRPSLEKSDTLSVRSAQRPRYSVRSRTAPNQPPLSKAPAERYPMHPREDTISESNRSLPGNRPFAVRKASFSGLRPNPMTSTMPPLPAPPHIRRSEAVTASSAPLPDMASAVRPPLLHEPPDSPTDPFYVQGRRSPLPPDTSKRPMFSADRSSSASSLASSSNGRFPSSRRGQAGAHKGICRGCSQMIMAGEKSISSKDGRLSGRYHKHCFACHTCRKPFQTADFYVYDDLPYCAEHYHVKNDSLCSGCGQGIEGQYLEATTTIKGKKADKFHRHCLRCAACQTGLQDDYFEWMGKVYCEQDAQRVARAQTQPSPSGPFLSPRPSPSPSLGSASPAPSGSHSPLPRTGLPSDPRAGLRTPVLGSAGTALGPGNRGGFLSPNPPPPSLPAGTRFPERRTTKLMMI